MSLRSNESHCSLSMAYVEQRLGYLVAIKHIQMQEKEYIILTKRQILMDHTGSMDALVIQRENFAPQPSASLVWKVILIISFQIEN